jgi:hypothetical protein
VNTKVYPQWDTSLGDLRKLLIEAGKDPAASEKYAPNRAGFNQRHDRAMHL